MNGQRSSVYAISLATTNKASLEKAGVGKGDVTMKKKFLKVVPMICHRVEIEFGKDRGRVQDIFSPSDLAYIDLYQISIIGPIITKTGFNDVNEWTAYEKDHPYVKTKHECEMFKVVFNGGDSFLEINAAYYDDLVEACLELEDSGTSYSMPCAHPSVLGVAPSSSDVSTGTFEGYAPMAEEKEKEETEE